MEGGGFFDEIRHLDFFPGSEKHCEPVSSSTPRNSDPANQGIYQEEESVDLSALLESCNSDHQSIASDAVATSASNTTSAHSDNTAPVYNVVSSTYPGYPGYLHSLSTHHNMFGNDGYNTHHHMHQNPMEVTPNSPSMVVDHAAPSPGQHIVQIEDPSAPFSPSPNQNRPAPGKAPRPKSKKQLDKRSDEYRVKRDRNNVAVRKSREKSRIRVQDTEKRVKELEEENGQLQSKVAMLTKELNVLKNLFTSAGVSQPANLPKDKRLARK